MIRGVAVAFVAMLIGASSAKGGQVAAAALGEEDLRGRLDRLLESAEQQERELGELEASVEQAEQRPAQEVRLEQVRQLVRELVSESDFRESLFPDQVQVGYQNGFYIRSADEQFSLYMNLATQIRYTYINRQSDDRNRVGRQGVSDRSGAEIERLYVVWRGNLWGPELTYQIAIEGETDNPPHAWRTYYAWVNYAVSKGLQFQAGLFRIPFGRQHMTSSRPFQLTDRSLAQYVFGPDRSVGVMMHGKLFDDKLQYMAAVHNGVLDNIDVFTTRFGRPDPVQEMDSTPAVSARLVYALLGKVEPLDETDLAWHESPNLEVGASFLFDNNNGDQTLPILMYERPDRFRLGRGGIGLTNFVQTRQMLWGADMAFKYRGFSANAEWMMRVIESDSDESAWERYSGNEGWKHQQGGHLQLSYFVVPKRLEVSGRFGGVFDNEGDSSMEWGGGVNYYIHGHNLKIQADVIHLDESPMQTSSPNYILNDEATLFRIQLHMEF